MTQHSAAQPGAPESATDVKRVLAVRDLHTEFRGGASAVRAVEGVSFDLREGERVGLVGESGSGKSVTALSIMRLVMAPGEVVSGEVIFNPDSDSPRNVRELEGDELRRFRGRDVAMVFQDPMSALNPLIRIGAQIAEGMLAHETCSRSEATERSRRLIRNVGLPDVERVERSFPHELSGGMRQRVMIACALANDPKLVLADEPTTALDVTVQAVILRLLRDLTAETGTALMLVSHNLAVIGAICTRVLVMYAGRIVEEGPTEVVLTSPEHPYTWSLLQAIPRADGRRAALANIPGSPPDMANPPTGCKFHPRCPFRTERCIREEPPLGTVGESHAARCWVLMRNTGAKVGSAGAGAST